jgi:hypothetical protein
MPDPQRFAGRYPRRHGYMAAAPPRTTLLNTRAGSTIGFVSLQQAPAVKQAPLQVLSLSFFASFLSFSLSQERERKK